MMLPHRGGIPRHATRHQNGGTDEINVAGLSGVLADAQRADTLVESAGPTNLPIGAVPATSIITRDAGTGVVGVALASTGSCLVRETGGTLVDSVRDWNCITGNVIGFLLGNTTPATGGVPVQYSPILALCGGVWDTDGSADVWNYGFQLRLTSGANTYGTLYVVASKNGAAWSQNFAQFYAYTLLCYGLSATGAISTGTFLQVGGDPGSGGAGTKRYTNAVVTPGDTLAVLGNYAVDGDAGIFYGWVTAYHGTTRIRIPAWQDT